jgi:hypothetical protein
MNFAIRIVDQLEQQLYESYGVRKEVVDSLNRQQFMHDIDQYIAPYTITAEERNVKTGLAQILSIPASTGRLSSIRIGKP